MLNLTKNIEDKQNIQKQISKKISFQSGLGNDVITVKDVDLFKMNIKKNYTLKISGAMYGKNNQDTPILISSLTKNKIIEPASNPKRNKIQYFSFCTRNSYEL